MGHRMSSLPITQYCGMAGHLSASGASGRSAAVSTCFHAKAAGDPEYFRLYTLLSQRERKECDEMILPGPQDIDGHALTWSEGMREMAVAIGRDGYWVDPESPDAISIGHLDNAWVIGDTVYVADIKRTKWTAKGNQHSLQLKAYGIAMATKHSAKYMRLAIYAATEGEWIWGEKIDIESMEASEIFAQVVHAATNGESIESAEYATGEHCADCWDRLRCKQWLIPFDDPKAKLKALSEGDGLNELNAADALQYIQDSEKVLKKAKSTVQAYLRENEIRKDGKVYKQCWGKSNRVDIDYASLEKEHPDLVQKYQKDAGPRNMGFRWVKTKED